MNDLIADVLVKRLMPLKVQGLLADVVGLVQTIESDALSGNKKKLSYPAPIGCPTGDCQDDWKRLVPDQAKPGFVFFEGGTYRTSMVNGFKRVQTRLTLICWFNGKLINNCIPDRIGRVLMATMCPNGRTIPIMDEASAVTSLQLSGYSSATTDPFLKYTGFAPLFNFKTPPYGYVAIELALTAFVDESCLV
ncbi:hypothetical protein [Spirosoma sp.]|uniref:hypothetical protein n=1 Tax=Spirosoma sp. TaxID=1899569 RepID=UPI00262BF370|nr:hypothetical protein [Spirosoma sp.]MCX6218353.1 hypothetical protein [Spirosoma sp.]